MTAQEIIEKIRAEVERLNTIQLKRIQEGDLVDAEPYGKNEAYNNVLSVLSDLEKEEKPTTAEGLEEEIDKVYLPNRVVGYVQGIGKILLGREAFANIARHFAKWQKEQIMKEAVEGTIICYNDDTYAVESCCYDNKEHHYHSGDKGHIIFVKED